MLTLVFFVLVVIFVPSDGLAGGAEVSGVGEGNSFPDGVRERDMSAPMG